MAVRMAGGRPISRRYGKRNTRRRLRHCICRGLEQRMNITLDRHNRGVAPWAMALHNYHQIITDFGEDVHVIRYEDLCLRWGRVLRDLAAWEPRLGDINISRVPTKGKATLPLIL